MVGLAGYRRNGKFTERKPMKVFEINSVEKNERKPQHEIKSKRVEFVIGQDFFEITPTTDGKGIIVRGAGANNYMLRIEPEFGNSVEIRFR